MAIDLLTLDEEALAKLYAERIQPILSRNEDGRIVAFATYRMRCIWGALGSLAVAGATFFWWDDAFNAMIFGGAAFAGAHWYAYQPLQEVATATKQQSLSAIASAIGCSYDLAAFEPDAFARFTEIELVPSCDRSAFQDGFRGEFRG